MAPAVLSYLVFLEYIEAAQREKSNRAPPVMKSVIFIFYQHVCMLNASLYSFWIGIKILMKFSGMVEFWIGLILDILWKKWTFFKSNI